MVPSEEVTGGGSSSSGVARTHRATASVASLSDNSFISASVVAWEQSAWSTAECETTPASDVPPPSSTVPIVTFLNGSTLQVDLDRAQQTPGISPHVQYRVLYWTTDARCAPNS
eukprot:732563-Prorocentrum_minimum.AAC.1